MKKIIIIDGGPRKNMNTAQMLQQMADGASSVNNEIEVKTIRLYDLEYKGCISCMACKLKDKTSNVCKYRDSLTPILEELAVADGLIIGSPIYFSEVTAQLRAFFERLIFPWLSYNDYSLTAKKRMPVILSYTMNATAEQAKDIYKSMAIIENSLARALEQPKHIDAHYTYQVKNYDRYELAQFPEPKKRAYREQHWENDLKSAYQAGRQMAESILTQ